MKPRYSVDYFSDWERDTLASFVVELEKIICAYADAIDECASISARKKIWSRYRDLTKVHTLE